VSREAVFDVKDRREIIGPKQAPTEQGLRSQPVLYVDLGREHATLVP